MIYGTTRSGKTIPVRPEMIDNTWTLEDLEDAYLRLAAKSYALTKYEYLQHTEYWTWRDMPAGISDWHSLINSIVVCECNARTYKKWHDERLEYLFSVNLV